MENFLIRDRDLCSFDPRDGYRQRPSISGDVIGTVVDATGAAVPSAIVTVENIATGVKANATTS